MTSSAHEEFEDREIVRNAASTDQHVTGSDETGEFITDRAPTADTPADGSSNAGINRTGGNLQDPADDRS